MSSLQESFRVKILLKYRIIWIKDGWIVYTWNVIVSRHFLQTILISAAFFEWVILSEVVFLRLISLNLDYWNELLTLCHSFISFSSHFVDVILKNYEKLSKSMMLNGSYFLLDQFHGSAYCEWTVGACGFRKTFVWRQATLAWCKMLTSCYLPFSTFTASQVIWC